MNKRIRLSLTGFGEVLTKEAQEKLDREEETIVYEDLTCESGHTRRWYEDMNIPIPKELLEKERNFENGIDFNEEDYEILEYPCRIYEDQIVGYVWSENKTVIFTKTGLSFSVKETVEEIDELINNN